VDRLQEDHAHAKELAAILHRIPSVSLNPGDVETNIVFFDVKESGRSPADIVAALREAGVLINAVGGSRFRAVTHLDITGADVEQAGVILTRVLAAR